MNLKFRRLLAWLMNFLMIFDMAPVSAFATDVEAPSTSLTLQPQARSTDNVYYGVFLDGEVVQIATGSYDNGTFVDVPAEYEGVELTLRDEGSTPHWRYSTVGFNGDPNYNVGRADGTAPYQAQSRSASLVDSADAVYVWHQLNFTASLTIIWMVRPARASWSRARRLRSRRPWISVSGSLTLPIRMLSMISPPAFPGS